MLPVNTVNPFVGSWQKTEGVYNKIKTVILFPLALIRFIFAVMALLMCAGWCRLALIGIKAPEDIGWFRRNVVINPAVSFFCRLLLFILGFYWISVKGKRDPRARVMICNHTTMIDVVVLLYIVAPSFLSKASVLQVPLIGTICESMQVIGVDRANAKDKERTRQIMKDHVSLKNSPPLLVFPEGTTSRYDTVLRFKPGAFEFGLPVQPMLLHWRWNFTDPSSTATTSVKSWALQILCQFYHYVEVEFLPVLEPDEGEKSNPLFFANNARKVIVQGLQRRAAKPTWWTPGFVHEVYAVHQGVDDFLVWKRFLAANMTDLSATLQTFSLESIRDAIELAAPVLSSRKRVDLSFALAASERYARIWHASTIPGHTHKSLLSYDDLTQSTLGDNAGSKAKQIFVTAFLEAAIFPCFNPTAEAIDFRQFVTALTWLSNCVAVWGDPFTVFEDAPMDPGVVKWATVRSKIVFAFLCSIQVMKDDIFRDDCVQLLGVDAGIWWDAIFEPDAALTRESGNAKSSDDKGLRLELDRFKDGIVHALTSVISGSSEPGAELSKERLAKRAAYDLIERCLGKIDAKFSTNYYEGGAFFLTEAETTRLHDKVIPLAREQSVDERVVEDPSENV